MLLSDCAIRTASDEEDPLTAFLLHKRFYQNPGHSIGLNYILWKMEEL